MAEDCQALVLDEVFVVFDVAGGEGNAIGETTGGHPRIVERAWAASEAGVCGDDAPGPSYVMVAVKDVLARKPLVQHLSAVWSPLALLDPSGQFAEGDEGQDEWPASQQACHVGGQLALDQQ